MVGRIIGKGGATIRQLSQDSGAEFKLANCAPNAPEGATRTLTISGTKAQMEKAKALVAGQMSVAGASVAPMVGMATGIAALGGGEITQLSMPIEGTSIGKIVGKGGETIKGIQAKTGCARIQIDPDTNMCKLSGSEEAVTWAQAIITAIVVGDSVQKASMEPAAPRRALRRTRQLLCLTRPSIRVTVSFALIPCQVMCLLGMCHL